MTVVLPGMAGVGDGLTAVDLGAGGTGLGTGVGDLKGKGRK